MKTSQQKVYWVTGVAGFIGSHLTEVLLKTGATVVGLDNFDPFYDKKVKEKNLRSIEKTAQETGSQFLFKEWDIRLLHTYSLQDVPLPTQIVHLAAKAGIRPSLEQPMEYNDVNITGTQRILEFCKVHGIQELAFGSSSSVYGNDSPVPFSENAVADRPISPYASTKRAGELVSYTYSHLYGIKVAALRFFTVYGPRQRPDLAIHKFAKLIAQKKPISLYGDGTTSRDYTYISDIVNGIQGAMRWLESQKAGAFEVFNLGGSAGTTLKDLVQMLEKHLDMKAEIRWEPRQPGDVERTFADISKSQKILGYQPRFPLEQGIQNFTEWFRNES